MRMFFIGVGPATAQDNERADTTFKLGSHWLLELDPGGPPFYYVKKQVVIA
jgi:hypothetical protein